MQLHLYEHQSTVNPNLPLRYLRYVNIQYEKLTVGENIYSRKKIRIPTPKFIVFYNGTEKQPERKEMRLSDLYMTDTGEVNLELVVLQLNINDKMNKELKENCRKLSEYTQYVECIRKHQENKILEEAVECAIEECINKGILREFLIKNRAEVRQMSIFEYDEELHRKSLYEEGKEEGREEGGANKLQKIVYYMLEQKQTPETISNTIGEPLQNIYKLQESYIEMVREKEKYGDKKRGS